MNYNNDNELFLMNQQLYTKLATFNTKYHLYSECLKKNNYLNCPINGIDLEKAYIDVRNDINKLITILNNNKTINGAGIDVENKIKENNELRMKLQNDLDQLQFNKSTYSTPDFAIEAGLLWIFLATTCIYFILVQ